jgi:uncharacterized membrane protein YeaQ/YmgE (transglycosylase-associated protein family)
MNTPAPLKKTNYDSRIFITAFVVNSVIANRIFNKMHGQPFWLHIIVAATVGGVITWMVMWATKCFRRC